MLEFEHVKWKSVSLEEGFFLLCTKKKKENVVRKGFWTLNYYLVNISAVAHVNGFLFPSPYSLGTMSLT